MNTILFLGRGRKCFLKPVAFEFFLWKFIGKSYDKEKYVLGSDTDPVNISPIPNFMTYNALQKNHSH